MKIRVTKTILLEAEIEISEKVDEFAINNELEDVEWLPIEVYYQVESEDGKFKFDREGSE